MISSLSALLGLSVLVVLADPAQAQQVTNGLPTPRLFTILPSGARAGTTVDVAFTGADLEDPEKLVFSHPGISAEAIVTPPPAVDPKNPPKVPPKATITAFKVTVKGDVPLGHHDCRLITKGGISNPRVFVIGDMTEVVEKEPNSEVEQAQKVALNSTINGNLTGPVDVDYYSFAGKKGQRIVFYCQSTSIDSKLDPELKIITTNNRLLTSNVSTYRDRDVVIDTVLPDDGDYFVRLCESTHTQGNAEHFYRLTITTAPWIDAIVPSTLPPGKATQVTVWGRNLPGGQKDPTAKTIENEVLEKVTVTVTAPADAALLTKQSYSGTMLPPAFNLDGFDYRLKNDSGSSNPYFLTFARGPVVVDNEKNKKVETAQEITVPCELNGRIEKSGDIDWYAFTAKKGDIYSFEMVSDRLGAAGDMYFMLKNAENKQVIIDQDDNTETTGTKFFTFTRDPAIYRFTVPADGKYQLMIASRTGTSECGPRNLYTLRITPEMPDFRLVVLSADWKRPEGCLLNAGGEQNYTVFAWRRDGFAGDIALSVEGLPKGVTCPPQILGSNVKHTFLVLSAAADAPVWTGEVKVKGTATINGKAVTHEARPASICWPLQQGQQAPTISRLDRSLPLAVREQAPFSLATKIDKEMVVQGDKATVTVKLNRMWADLKGPIQVQQQQQTQGMTPYIPQGLVIAALTMNPGQNDGQVAVTVGPNTPPGTYNIVLTTLTQMPYSKDPTKQKQNINIVLPSQPVTLVVLPKVIGTVTATPANTPWKPGTNLEVVVKINKQFEYNGSFKVELVLPPEVKDVTGAAVTIPPGQTEAKLILAVPATATPGARNNLTIRATTMFNDKVPVVQETKINVNVVK